MDEKKSGRRKLQEGKETLFHHHLYQSDFPTEEKTANLHVSLEKE